MKKEKKYIAHMMEVRKCLISYVVIILVDAVLLLCYELELIDGRFAVMTIIAFSTILFLNSLFSLILAFGSVKFKVNGLSLKKTVFSRYKVLNYNCVDKIVMQLYTPLFDFSKGNDKYDYGISGIRFYNDDKVLRYFTLDVSLSVVKEIVSAVPEKILIIDSKHKISKKYLKIIWEVLTEEQKSFYNNFKVN